MIFFSHFWPLTEPPVTFTFRTSVKIYHWFVEVDILHVPCMFGQVWWIREFNMNFSHIIGPLRSLLWLTFRTRVKVYYGLVEVDILHVQSKFSRVRWIRPFIMIFFHFLGPLRGPHVTLTFRARVKVYYRFVEVDTLHIPSKFGRVRWIRKFIMNFFHFLGPLRGLLWPWPL